VSANEDLEKRAAAAVAYVLKAQAKRRDLGGARVRDYDLLFDDRPDEPLEVTRFADVGPLSLIEAPQPSGAASGSFRR